jgi:membrane protease YdiL (CAAX protease family)
VIVFSVLFILPQCLISGFETGAPLYAVVFMIPMMLLGGGLEEAGWRYILQPMFEKKFNFIVSTLLVSAIWWMWHLPLFFIQGVSQYGQNFFAFGINVLGLSFALASIRKASGSVWLCVLFHCIVNALSGVYIVNNNIWGNVASAAVLIVVSIVLVTVNDKKKILK